MKKILGILGVLSMSILLVACNTETTKEQNNAQVVLEDGSSVTVTGKVYPVVVENFKFMPTTLEIKVGDMVEWNNRDFSDYIEETDEVDAVEERDTEEDGVKHTITFENGDFDASLPPGASVSHIFIEKGEFRYFCQFNPGMQGNVIVS